MEVREGYAPLARLVIHKSETVRPLVVGIAGGVAVGKSTAAAALTELMAPGQVQVVATDGFLLPNAVLESRGLLHRKGFPESYDAEAVESFIDAARRGDTPLSVPEYSHVTYDVLPDRRVLDPADVVVLEGVNALRFSDRLDIGVYIEAPEAAMEEWYVTRFLELCDAPPPGSFYASFGALDHAGRDAVARSVWRDVNLVNLRECIQPTRKLANVVIDKRPDHSVGRIDVMSPVL